MTYQVYKPIGANGVNPVLVPDNAIDLALYDSTNRLGVQLPGKNSVDYGLPFAQNIVQMVSNFAGSIIPNDSISMQGQLWYNATSASAGNLYVKFNSNTTGGIANWKKIVLLDSLETGNVSVVNPSVLPKTGDMRIVSGAISIFGNNSWTGTTLNISNGGTGAATANDAFNALAPNQIGNDYKFLTTDGTNAYWAPVDAGGGGIPGGTAGQIPFQYQPSTTTFAPNFTYVSGTITLGNSAGAIKTSTGNHGLIIQTGAASPGTTSGTLLLSTGNSSSGAAGNITLVPGTGTINGAQTLVSGGAGTGGSGNNNGGALILAGGTSTGTGTAGIIRFDTGAVEALRITPEGSLSFSKTQQRILGDFSSATISNRVLFQTTTANNITSVGAVPSGSSTQAGFTAYNNSNPTNSANVQLLVTGTEARLTSGNTGTANTLPLTVYTGSTEKMRVLVNGNVGIGTTTPGSKLDVAGSVNVSGNVRLSGAVSGYVQIAAPSSSTGTTYTLPTADGSAGQVLATNGAGVLSWGTGVPTGAILLWSGASTAIPGGWALCDGTSGRPDLRDRFVIGAGNSYAVGATGGSKDAVLVKHNHGGETTTSSAGSHTHYFGNQGRFPSSNNPDSPINRITGDNPTDGDPPTESLKAVKYLDDAGSHTHTVTVAEAGVDGTNKNLPPYYALCYIIKI